MYFSVEQAQNNNNASAISRFICRSLFSVSTAYSHFAPSRQLMHVRLEGVYAPSVGGGTSGLRWEGTIGWGPAANRPPPASHACIKLTVRLKRANAPRKNSSPMATTHAKSSHTAVRP